MSSEQNKHPRDLALMMAQQGRMADMNSALAEYAEQLENSSMNPEFVQTTLESHEKECYYAFFDKMVQDAKSACAEGDYTKMEIHFDTAHKIDLDVSAVDVRYRLKNAQEECFVIIGLEHGTKKMIKVIQGFKYNPAEISEMIQKCEAVVKKKKADAAKKAKEQKK